MLVAWWVSTNNENNLLCLTWLRMTAIFRHAGTPIENDIYGNTEIG
jgi:hypothetical protein